MRKTIYIVLAALGLCLFAGCGSSDKEKVSPTAKQLVGEWQLKTWTGETPQDFDIYLSFGADNTFEIYQRLAEVKYQKFTGSYQVQNDVLSGKYSGGKNFGSTYDISFNESGSTLTLTSATNVTEVSVYERSTIPNSVKEGAAVMKSTRSAVRLGAVRRKGQNRESPVLRPEIFSCRSHSHPTGGRFPDANAVHVRKTVIFALRKRNYIYRNIRRTAG